MEMMFIIAGLGLGVKGVNLTALKSAKLLFRDAPDEPAEAIVIKDSFDAGSAGPNAGGSAVVSEWVPLNPSKDTWLFDPNDLVGKKGKVEVPGTSLILNDSSLGLKFRTLTEHYRIKNEIHLKQVPVHDVSQQIGGFSVKGTIKKASDVDEFPGGSDA